MSRSFLPRLLWLLIGLLPLPSGAAGPVSLWPTIAFIRGQDLCQYQDVYGKPRSELALAMTAQLKDLLSAGVESRDVAPVLFAIEALIDKNRLLATKGLGMDVLLEGSLKAAVDTFYRDLKPKEKKLQFVNPSPLLDLLRDLRQQQRQGTLDTQQLAKISGFAWGTYSFGPSCQGDIQSSIHIELATGESLSFQAQGRPESVMNSIAAQMFAYFQRTRFPSSLRMGNKTLWLLGAPGAPIGQAPSPEVAEKACVQNKSRLPLLAEYEYLSALGDWNGGITLDHKYWAMADGHILAPDLRNPSPVRHPEEINSNTINYYCVR